MKGDPSKRNTVRHSNPVMDRGFAITSVLLIFDEKLSDGAFRLYVILSTYNRKLPGEPADAAFPSLETLAVKMGCTTKTISRRLDELEERGLVQIKQKGGMQTNRYWLNDPKIPPDSGEGDSGSGGGKPDNPVQGNGGGRRNPANTQDKNVQHSSSSDRTSMSSHNESEEERQVTGHPCQSDRMPVSGHDRTSMSHEVDAVEVDALSRENPCGSPASPPKPPVRIGSSEPEKPKLPPSYATTDSELREWPRFSRYYQAHPINDNQKPAFLAWMEDTPADEELEAMLADLRRRKKEHTHYDGAGKKDFRRGFKYPDSYLRDRAWERGETGGTRPPPKRQRSVTEERPPPAELDVGTGGSEEGVDREAEAHDVLATIRRQFGSSARPGEGGNSEGESNGKNVGGEQT